ncbi:hypothetical protein GCM10027190_29410 [Spirosoma areae]
MLDTFMSGLTAYEAVKDEAGELIDFRLTFVNQGSLQQARGVVTTRDQIVGRTLTELYPRTREEGMWYRYQQVYQTGQPVRQEHYYPALNRWMDVSVQKSGDSLLVTYDDITARKQTELAYQQQADLLRNVMDASPAGISFMNAQRDERGQLIDFRLMLTNQATARMTGRTVADIQGKSVTETFPSYRPLGVYDHYRTVLETGQPARFEVYYQGDGLENWFAVAAYPQGDGVVGTFLDVTPIRQAQQAAQQQADLLTQISQSMQMAVSAHLPVRDDDGRIVDFRYTYFNEKAKEWLPVDWQSVVGQTVRTMQFAANVDHTIARMARVVETGQYDSFDATLPDGRIFYNIISPSGEGTVSTFIDVTGQRQNERRIAELKATAEQQADLAKSVLNASLTAVALYKAVRSDAGVITDFCFTLANQTTLTIFGMTADELYGKTLTQLNPPLRNSQAFDQYVAVCETGQPVVVEREVRGRYYYVSVVKFGDGILTSSVDITQNRLYRDQLEQTNIAMQQQQELLHSVLDGSQNAIIAFEAVRAGPADDQPGRITDFRYVLQNEANRQRVGRSDAVLLGRTMLEFFPDVATNGLLDQYAQVVETGEMLRFELEYTYQDIPGWFDYSVVKRGDGIVMTVHDKTAERRARQLVEQANAELQRSNNNLQSFAYVASHDLQEPLRKIRSFGDMVMAEFGPQLPENGQDMLRRMQLAAERMSILIRDILALSRLTTQKQAFASVDLSRLITEVLTDLETMVAEKGAIVEIADLPTVPGDALQLRQLFQNLLANALKFTHPKQSPRVRVSCQRLSAQELPPGLLAPATTTQADKASVGPASASRSYYALTVSDDGIGFDAQKHGETIFGAFQRLHGRTGNYAGTGIGLAIARRVVENHSGGIRVQSREGEGAAFTVYLPL